MSNLYLLKDGILSPPPHFMILEDGTTILNFHLVAQDYGYKELIQEPQPLYDEAYQSIQPNFAETETHILEEWEVIYTLTLDEYKQQKYSELEDAYSKSLCGNFESIGYTFGYSKEDQGNFTKVTALFALKPDKVDTPWNTKSHGIVLLTKEQYLMVTEAAENHEWFNLGKLWNYKHLVDIAQSYDEVSEIKWK